MLVYYKSCKKQNGVAADVHSSHQEEAFTDHSVKDILLRYKKNLRMLPKNDTQLLV